MNPLLEKLATEKKEITLTGNYNINILNCNSDNDTSNFIDTMHHNWNNYLKNKSK